MRIFVGELCVWCHMEVCVYPPGLLNMKLWRAFKPPSGWKKCRYTPQLPRGGGPVGFKPVNPLTTPMLTREEIEVLHAKLCLILDKEAA